MASKRYRPANDVFRHIRLNLEILEDRDLPSSTLPLLDSTADYATDHILVRWLEGSPAETAQAQAIGNNTWSIALDPGMSVAEATAYYASLAGVDFAQPDYIITYALNANDPGFGVQWALNNTGQSGGRADADIDATDAWDYTTGSRSIVVAVIDSGVDFNHPDLRANMWRNTGEVAGNGVDDDRNGIVDDVYGANFIGAGAASGNPLDDNGHGTHVAGTIGAVGNNGVGVTGVAWNVEIMALKFLNSAGSGRTSDAVEAIYYAVNNGAKILNNSWGGGGYSSALASAIDYARSRGVIVVAAAGNNASNNDAVAQYPANYGADNVVSVAATDRNDNLAAYSNYGRTTVDLAAPGSSIYSTYPTNLDGANPYRYYSGTSMATPHVAGALALVWSAHPEWSYSQVVSAVLNSVDRLAVLDGRVATGGRLNVGNAIIDALPSGPAGPYITQVDWAGNTATRYDRVRLTFSVAINSASFTAADVSLTNPTGQQVAVTRLQAVAGSGSRQFDLFFSPQTQPGDYTLAIGPDVRDSQNRPMDQNGNGRAGESTDVFTARFAILAVVSVHSGNVNVPIRDMQTSTASLFIGTHLTIGDLNVTVNISHSYDGDLIIKLVSPTGQEVLLANRRGAWADHFARTTFDDEAGTAIAAGAAPFTGSFRPDGALSALNGTDLYGTWKLVVSDVAHWDIGTIQNFKITATASAGATGASARSMAVSESSASASVSPRESVSQALDCAAGPVIDLTWISLPSGQTFAQTETAPRSEAAARDDRDNGRAMPPTIDPALVASMIDASAADDEPADDEDEEDDIEAMLAALFVRI